MSKNVCSAPPAAAGSQLCSLMQGSSPKVTVKALEGGAITAAWWSIARAPLLRTKQCLLRLLRHVVSGCLFPMYGIPLALVGGTHHCALLRTVSSAESRRATAS